MRLLIDECLSEELAHQARQHGHPDASHVRWIGKGCRGTTDTPGNRGQYPGLDLHAGLLCLNGPVGMDLDIQVEVFEVALAELVVQRDLVNQVPEISLESAIDEDIRVIRYALPKER